MQNVSLTLEDCSRFFFEVLKVLSVFSFAYFPCVFFLTTFLSWAYTFFIVLDFCDKRSIFLFFSLFSFLCLVINRIPFGTVSEDSCVSPFPFSKILFFRRCLRMGHDFFRGENFFCDHIRNGCCDEFSTTAL